MLKEVVVLFPSKGIEGTMELKEITFKTKTAYGLVVNNNSRGELVVDDVTDVEDPKVPKSKRKADTLAVFKEWSHWIAK